MRKLFEILMSLFVVVAVAACGNEKGVGNEEENNGPFEIKIYEITAIGADVEILPQEYDGRYYFDALTEESYNYFKVAGFQKFIDNEVSKRMTSLEVSKEDALDGMLSMANDGFTFQTLYPDTKYYIVAMGVGDDGMLTTEVSVKSFKTNNVAQSGNTFKIEITDVSYDSASFKITPSLGKDKYFVDIWSKAIVDELGDKEFIKYCVDVYQSMGMIETQCVIGERTFSNMTSCQPGRDYYIVVFGFDDGYPTTSLTKKAFSTKAGDDPATCTFEIEVSNVLHDRATIAVTPSDKYCVYASDMVRKDELELLMTTESLTQQQALARVLSDLLDTVQSDLQITRAEATEVITYFGAEEDNPSGRREETRRYLKEQTEYVVWAVAVDTYGRPLSQFAVSESFTTPREIVSTATATVSVEKYFDGGMLDGYSDKQAVVPVKVTPSADAAHWYVALYATDVTGASRATIISNLTSSGYLDENPLIATSVWNMEITAVAIAVDADGNFGEPSFQVLTCTKDGAAPASEFDEYK